MHITFEVQLNFYLKHLNYRFVILIVTLANNYEYRRFQRLMPFYASCS